MSCYHPKVVFIWKPDSLEKKNIVYFSENPDLDSALPLEAIGTTKFMRNKKNGETGLYTLSDIVRVPCGKCYGCVMDNSKMWTGRMLAEKKDATFSYFLTLTYDNEHLPFDYQLKKKDLQNWLKRLRKYYAEKYGISNIRYYACGEYGGERGRPHYHVILFNAPLYPEDFLALGVKDAPFNFKEYGTSEIGCKVYRSEEFDQIRGGGLVFVGEAETAALAYVARYVNKKRLSKLKSEDFPGIQAEFNLMSRRPGIGQRYIEKISDPNDLYIVDKGNIYFLGRYAKEKHPEFESDYLKNKIKNLSIQSIKNRSNQIQYQHEKVEDNNNKLEKLLIDKVKYLKRKN